MAEDRFFSKYHKAVVGAMGDRLERAGPRIASGWINEWRDELGGRIENPEEFRTRFEQFLTEGLGFADFTGVGLEDDLLTIDVEGCRICYGNELLRREEKPTFCPILPTGLMAISRVLGRKATLLGVEKEGTAGRCTIRYRLDDRR